MGRKVADRPPQKSGYAIRFLGATLPTLEQQEEGATELHRTARRLDGGLLLTPRSAELKATATATFNRDDQSPRGTRRDIYEGAAGISSFSLINAAKVSKAERWVPCRTTHDNVVTLVSPR